MRALLLGGIAVGLLAFPGCVYLAEQDQVKDLRVLAIRTSPPEYLYSFLHFLPPEQRGPFPLGPYGMDVDALVVDPKGRDVDVNIRLCPEDADDACPGYHVRDTAPADEIRAITPWVQPVTLSGSPDLQRGGEVTLPTYVMTFSDRAMDYMVPHDVNGRISLLGIISPAMPSVVVWARTRNGAQQETAFHRFQLNADITASFGNPAVEQQLGALVQQFLGMPPCTAEQELQAEEQDRVARAKLDLPREGFFSAGEDTSSVQCVRRRVVNHNPHIERVLYSTEEGGGGFGPGGRQDQETDGGPLDPLGGGSYQDLVGRLELAPGDSVRLRPLVGAGDRERYQRFAADDITGKVKATAHFEDMAFAWYTTVGTIERTTSQGNDPYPDTSYNVSLDAPDGPAHVWVIVRDQRGGVDWKRLDFNIRRQDNGRGGGGGSPFGGMGPGRGGG